MAKIGWLRCVSDKMKKSQISLKKSFVSCLRHIWLLCNVFVVVSSNLQHMHGSHNWLEEKFCFPQVFNNLFGIQRKYSFLLSQKNFKGSNINIWVSQFIKREIYFDPKFLLCILKFILWKNHAMMWGTSQIQVNIYLWSILFAEKNEYDEIWWIHYPPQKHKCNKPVGCLSIRYIVKMKVVMKYWIILGGKLFCFSFSHSHFLW